MKITSQRSLFWAVNFALLGCLVGLMVLIVFSYMGNQRKGRMNLELKSLEQGLKKVRKPNRDRSKDDKRMVLKTVLSAPLCGYIPPKKVEPVKANATRQAAPDLNTLLEIVFIASPNRLEAAKGAKGGPASYLDHTGVQLKIKSLSTIFYYREGQSAGLGEMDGDDTDKTLKQHGGAKILRIEESHILCEWAKKEVELRIGEHGAPTKIVVAGGGISYGTISSEGATRVPGMPTASLGILATDPKGLKDTLQLTKDGLAAFESGGGERMLDGISFKTSDTERGKALQIKTIPPQLGNYGLQPGDVIIKVDNRGVTSKESIVKYVRQTYRARSGYNIIYLRDGRQRSLYVRVPRNAASGGRLLRGRR